MAEAQPKRQPKKYGLFHCALAHPSRNDTRQKVFLDIFNRIDADKSGSLSIDEILDHIKQYDGKDGGDSAQLELKLVEFLRSHGDLETLFRKADVNNDGELQLDEFLALVDEAFLSGIKVPGQASKPSPAAPPRKPNPPTEQNAETLLRVLFDFDAVDASEVTVKIGDIVLLCGDAVCDEGWTRIRHPEGGAEGEVPTDYLEIVGTEGWEEEEEGEEERQEAKEEEEAEEEEEEVQQFDLDDQKREEPRYEISDPKLLPPPPPPENPLLGVAREPELDLPLQLSSGPVGALSQSEKVFLSSLASEERVRFMSMMFARCKAIQKGTVDLRRRVVNDFVTECASSRKVHQSSPVRMARYAPQEAPPPQKSPAGPLSSPQRFLMQYTMGR